jgi:RNA polymerase-binding protein DksA
LITIDIDYFRQRLVDERKRVADAIENIRRENPGSLEDEVQEMSLYDQHPGDLGTATLDREMASTLADHESRTLGAIDAALQRIEDGTYGRCERCDKPIGEERLEALPWATLCIDDKRKEERS